jgi:hypothetical protein
MRKLKYVTKTITVADAKTVGPDTTEIELDSSFPNVLGVALHEKSAGGQTVSYDVKLEEQNGAVIHDSADQAAYEPLSSEPYRPLYGLKAYGQKIIVTTYIYGTNTSELKYQLVFKCEREEVDDK